MTRERSEIQAVPTAPLEMISAQQDAELAEP